MVGGGTNNQVKWLCQSFLFFFFFKKLTNWKSRDLKNKEWANPVWTLTRTALNLKCTILYYLTTFQLQFSRSKVHSILYYVFIIYMFNFIFLYFIIKYFVKNNKKISLFINISYLNHIKFVCSLFLHYLSSLFCVNFCDITDYGVHDRVNI